MPILDKDSRAKRRASKKADKDVKLGERAITDAKKHGVDLNKNNDIGVMDEGRKARADKRVSDAVEEKHKEGFEKFKANQEKYKPEPIIQKPTEDEVKQSLRREKRARISDILVGVGRGLQGKDIDPEQFATSRIRKEREAQYEQYKTASTAAKQRKAEWESKYAQDQIDYLDGQLQRETNQLKAEKIKAEIENINTRTKWQKDKSYYKETEPKSAPAVARQLEKGEYSAEGTYAYSEALDALTDDPESLFPALEEGKAYSASQKEKEARNIILQMFDKKTDAKGNEYLVPKEGKEGYIESVRTDLALKAQQQTEIASILKKIKYAQMELDDIRDGGTGNVGYGWYDKGQINKLEQKIADLELQKKAILSGGKPKPTPEPKVKTKEVAKRKTAIDNAYDL